MKNKKVKKQKKLHLWPRKQYWGNINHLKLRNDEKHLFFLFATLLPLLVSAQTQVEIDGILYNLTSETKQAEVTSGTTKYSGSITIPTTVTYEDEDYSVTSIGNKAFYGCKSITNTIGLKGIYIVNGKKVIIK